jgi:hypothetical protein
VTRFETKRAAQRFSPIRDAIAQRSTPGLASNRSTAHLHEVQTAVSVPIRPPILTPGQRVNRILGVAAATEVEHALAGLRTGLFYSLFRLKRSPHRCDGRHETEIHPTGETIVLHEYPLSQSVAQIEHTSTVGGNSINHGRVVGRILSHFEYVIRSDLHYPQFSSFNYGLLLRCRYTRKRALLLGGGIGATPPEAVALLPLIAFDF